MANGRPSETDSNGRWPFESNATYYNNPETRNLADKLLPIDIGEDIWYSNMRPGDVRKIMKPSFWADVLKAWSKFSFRDRKIKVKS